MTLATRLFTEAEARTKRRRVKTAARYMIIAGHVIAIAGILALGWGFLAPKFVSAQSDFAAMVGVLVAVLTPFVAALYGLVAYMGNHTNNNPEG